MLYNFRSIYGSLSIMVILKDLNNNIKIIYKSVANFFDRSVDELSNIPLNDLLPYDYKIDYTYDLEAMKS